MTAYSEPPALAVVIPCYNSAVVLRRCVESVLKSAEDCPRLEGVYLVDGGSSDETSMLCRELAAHPLVRIIEHAPHSASAKRNAALQRIKADCLVFTDPDCVATPGWLKAFAEAARTWSCCTGRVTPLSPGLSTAVRTSPVDYTYRPTLLWRAFAFRPGSSNNLMIERGLLQTVGGFPEDLGPGTRNGVAEDTEVLYRVLRKGVSIRYCAAAAVLHDHPETEEVYLRKKELYGQGLSYFMLKRYYNDPATYLSLAVMMGHSLARVALNAVLLRPLRLRQALREARGRARGGWMALRK